VTTAAPTAEPARAPLQVWLVLLAGVVAASCAAIFIRYAQAEGIPSLAIAAGRLIVASLLLVPLAFTRHWHDIQRISRRDWLLIIVAGIFLAIHFASWVSSLEYAAVLISVVLVTTGPIWVALLEAVFLRARIGIIVVVGILIAVVGGIIIGVPSGGEGVTFDTQTLIGGGLALIGAIMVSVYVVIGRIVRGRVAVLPYIALVYAVAALVLIAALVVTQTPVTGYSAAGYGWIVIMGLVPQLIGHSAFNYALGYLPATVVSISTQVESIGSAIVAFLLFNEIPTEIQIIGSLVLAVGVTIAIIGQGRSTALAPRLQAAPVE
jgi:drug/metabolite transporter (DMT)-like permease